MSKVIEHYRKSILKELRSGPKNSEELYDRICDPRKSHCPEHKIFCAWLHRMVRDGILMKSDPYLLNNRIRYTFSMAPTECAA
ncbi:MAG: hypothetical protein LBV13_01265 [Methanomassiliicoccaceae archaeon]|jgi:hypothetical protein|nr:hypothetical protein [Methanomassiliicoccaceae archaeon]